MDSIKDAQGSSSKTLISLSRGFNIEILTGVTSLWKTKLNRSISTMKDRILKWLLHRHKMCCEKGGHYGRWAYMIWRCNFQTDKLVYDIEKKILFQRFRSISWLCHIPDLLVQKTYF